MKCPQFLKKERKENCLHEMADALAELRSFEFDEKLLQTSEYTNKE